MYDLSDSLITLGSATGAAYAASVAALLYARKRRRDRGYNEHSFIPYPLGEPAFWGEREAQSATMTPQGNGEAQSASLTPRGEAEATAPLDLKLAVEVALGYLRDDTLRHDQRVLGARIILAAAAKQRGWS